MAKKKKTVIKLGLAPSSKTELARLMKNAQDTAEKFYAAWEELTSWEPTIDERARKSRR